jgi:hypothetical protein
MDTGSREENATKQKPSGGTGKTAIPAPSSKLAAAPVAQEPLVLPTPPQTLSVSAAARAPRPTSMPPAQARADLPPEAGFTLLVDGHFKNSFDSLKQAKDAAGELKGRFPMLRVEIYDAATKSRHTV